MPVCTAARVQEKLADSRKSKCSRTDHKARSPTVTAKNIEHLWVMADRRRRRRLGIHSTYWPHKQTLRCTIPSWRLCRDLRSIWIARMQGQLHNGSMTGLLFNFNKVLAGIKQRKYYIMNGFHAKNKGAEMYMKLIKMLWWKTLQHLCWQEQKLPSQWIAVLPHTRNHNLWLFPSIFTSPYTHHVTKCIWLLKLYLSVAHSILWTF